MRTVRWFACCAALAGCSGTIFDAAPEAGGSPGGGSAPGRGSTTGIPGAPDSPTAPAPQPVSVQAALSQARRLTRAEFDRTMQTLLLDSSGSGAKMLPPETMDMSNPFENAVARQGVPGSTMLDTFEALVTDASARALANPQARAAILPCTPKNAADTACFTQFIKTFGRRVLRRPLATSEVTELLSATSFATLTGKTDDAVDVIIRSLLLRPEFMYRVEVGTPSATVTGARVLTSFELATRLSYTLWGTTPPDWLLDLAEAGTLQTEAEIRGAAEKLLADSRAKEQLFRFHAQWLGFAGFAGTSTLTSAMVGETKALIDSLVFDAPRDFLELFTSSKTFVTQELATHYGLSSPSVGTGAWVDYGAPGRRGILSHATVLSAFAEGNDSSPTRRGRFVRTRLLCEDISLPSGDVLAQAQATPMNLDKLCRKERLQQHASNGACAGCHQAMDPIGFGLERYDLMGRYRTTELNKPNCPLDTDGDVKGVGTFSGPGGLGLLLATNPSVPRCTVKHVFRFAMGRVENNEEAGLIENLTLDFNSNSRNLRQLLLKLVTEPAFRQFIPS